MAGAYIDPPKKIPFYIRIGMYVTKKVTGMDLLVPKLLAWYPRSAIGSAALEGLMAKPEGDISERLLKLIRIQVSLIVTCPFCIDMNSFESDRHGITDEEIRSLQLMEDSHTFTEREKLALKYARLISATPVKLDDEFMGFVKAAFNEREILMIASTASQVNYWARLIKSLGVPPAGFTDSCSID
ncbi:MAG: carboxymuconolactone decarboxylase family protein [Youngiibacter sp.]|nr:carboxymuconolactone decarboxylase family protein [Youngiibacter sp.]